MLSQHSRFSTITFAFTLAIAALCADASPAVIRVPGDQPSIQSAIDAAVDGDEIVVAPGVYQETLAIVGKGIHLRSVSGALKTIIDGAGLTAPILTCEPQWYHTITIDGFAFTHADGAVIAGSGYGGALSLIGSPTIRNCTFVDNPGGAISAGGYTGTDLQIVGCMFDNNGSGAVQLAHNNATFRECTFRNNPQRAVRAWECTPAFDGCTFEDNSSDQDGGAVYATGALGATLMRFTRCTFARNRAMAPLGLCEGGAIAAAHYADVNLILIECTFDSNIADNSGAVFNLGLQGLARGCRFVNNSGWGGAMRGLRGASRVESCTFEGNSGVEGGAISCSWAGANPTISHCTFKHNHASAGGAIAVTHGRGNVSNCVFDGNRSYAGGAIWHGGTLLQVVNCTFVRNYVWGSLEDQGGAVSLYTDCSLSVSNSAFWNNYPRQVSTAVSARISINFSLLEGGWQGGVGNLDVDPQFVDLGRGDLPLAPGSPCIDAANNAAAALIRHDLDGRPRVLDGDGDGARIVDMGAYEFGVGDAADAAKAP